MSTVVKSLLGDYSQAVSQFQAASMGSYAGPSTPIGLLGDMVGSVEGINPGDLVMNTASAMGARRPLGGGKGLKEFLFGTVLSLAGGAIMDRLRGVQDDFEEERREADDLVESAQQCSDAIEDVVHISDSALVELISAVIPLLNILTMLLQRHPLGKLIIPVISSIGGDLIEQTNDTISQTCRDRDTAIENCYCEFEQRCSDVCERELPETPPAPECGRDDNSQPCPQPSPEPCEPTSPEQPAPPTQPASPAAPAQPAAPTQPSEPSTPSQPSAPEAPSEQEAPPKETTEPAAVEPKECPQPESSPKPAPPVEPETAQKVVPAEEIVPKTQPQSVAAPEPVTTVPETECENNASEPCGCPEPLEDSSCDCEEAKGVRDDTTTTPADAGSEASTEMVPPTDPQPTEGSNGTDETHEPDDADTPDESEDSEDVEPPAPTEECTPEASCSGILGILGVGVALVGIGLLADAAMDFLENVPEPEPEPQPEDMPAPEPEPEPTPEPAGSDGVIAPPPELSAVPEPAPPAEKLAHVQAAGASVPAAPMPAPPPSPEAAPGTEQHDGPEAPQPDSPSVHARKAGQW